MKEKKNQKLKIRFIGIAFFVILAGIFSGCQETDEAEAMPDPTADTILEQVYADQ